LDANKYEVLSFDCYGTLVDWESGIISGLGPVLRSHRVEATDDEILSLHAQTEHKLQAASKRGSYLKYRDVQALPGSVRHWLPFADTVNALRTLKGRYRLAIISNIDDGLFALTAFCEVRQFVF
jgi:2-haloacid dehalogenase